MARAGRSHRRRLLEIELENRHFEIAGADFLLVEEQHADIFLADINFRGVGLARARHDADPGVVEIALEISFERLEMLYIGGFAQGDLDLEVVGTLLILVVDGEAPDTLLADKDISAVGVASTRHHANAR